MHTSVQHCIGPSQCTISTQTENNRYTDWTGRIKIVLQMTKILQNLPTIY